VNIGTLFAVNPWDTGSFEVVFEFFLLSSLDLGLAPLTIDHSWFDQVAYCFALKEFDPHI
jgi:hypothetical protein